MVKLVLHVATISVSSQMGTAASYDVKSASLHLSRHHAHYDAGTEVGEYAPDGIEETLTESIVVTILGEAIKGGVQRHD